MRKKLAAILTALLFSIGCSSYADDKKPVDVKDDKKPDDKKPDDKKPVAKLNIGDAAPPLKVTKWLQGAEVKAFAPGKVYVIEFWATWCAPCIRAMPHLNELQKEFKDKGLVIVGLTSKDENNTAEKVASFVEKNGKRFDYIFAYCDDRATDAAYMEASGQDGIPCSFVIGKDGKIAYIGHPMQLDDVLPKVLEGTWKGQADIDAIAKANGELDAILKVGQTDAEKALGQLIEFSKVHPVKAKAATFSIQRMLLTLQAKKFDDAKTLAEAMIAEAIAKKSADKAAFAAMLLGDEELNPKKIHIDVAMKAIETALQFEDKDIGLYIQAARLYFESGDKAKANALAEKAVAAADSDATRKQVEKLVAKYRIEKK